MGVCFCLQTCNSVVNMKVMDLVLGQCLMAISTIGIPYYVQKYLHFIMYYGSAFVVVYT